MHGTWAAVLLWLMLRGAGAISLDHLWTSHGSTPRRRP
jgi:uncharacterized membrane protein YphA (DoxX/SURF4 family)